MEMTSRFNDLLKRAHGAISQIRGGGGANFFLGKNGEVIYSKNNVCVHESGDAADEEPVHSPGYLTIHCAEDDQLGITLVLQWLPNALLEKTPSSIRCVSPRRGREHFRREDDDCSGVARLSCSNRALTMDSEDEEATTNAANLAEETFAVNLSGGLPDIQASTAVCLELNGGATDLVNAGGGQLRPTTLMGEGGQLTIPSINLIPNTPVEQQHLLEENINCTGRSADSSEPTSGEDGEGEEEEDSEDKTGEEYSSSPEEEEVGENAKIKCSSLDALRKSASLALSSIPEHFARQRNLMLGNEDGAQEETIAGNENTDIDDRSVTTTDQHRAVFFQKLPQRTKKLSGTSSLFSVNLGKMRSMRVFYSDPERTSGQLVIASPDSQYKIFHFHHTGLDKLTQLFEKWNTVKAKSAVGNDSPSSSGQDRHLLICPGAEMELSKGELDPEDGLYEMLGWDLWSSYVSGDGSVEDCFTIRKTIYFSSMETSLRKELWPFLLRVYAWNSTLEQREAIRNDMFLRYQRLKGQRIRRMAKGASEGGLAAQELSSVESSICKDVVRTDRRNSFFAGEENTNLDTMKSILLNYATKYPEIGYIQGMSDLLAPLLSTLRDEPLAYWCFVQLMEQTLFSQPPPQEHRSVMDIQLDYLRELLRLFSAPFHEHVSRLGGDAPSLMFVHRWILLFFKREFPARDALHIWEACWARYRTNYFHLFIACAIVGIYGPDVVAQQLPHDEILLYFSSLAMHMDARFILSKARGLLYQFHRLPQIPCTLAGLCSHETESEQWTSHIEPHGKFECTQRHEDGQCPFITV